MEVSKIYHARIQLGYIMNILVSLRKIDKKLIFTLGSTTNFCFLVQN